MVTASQEQVVGLDLGAGIRAAVWARDGVHPLWVDTVFGLLFVPFPGPKTRPSRHVGNPR